MKSRHVIRVKLALDVEKPHVSSFECEKALKEMDLPQAIPVEGVVGRSGWFDARSAGQQINDDYCSIVSRTLQNVNLSLSNASDEKIINNCERKENENDNFGVEESNIGSD